MAERTVIKLPENREKALAKLLNIEREIRELKQMLGFEVDLTDEALEGTNFTLKTLDVARIIGRNQTTVTLIAQHGLIPYVRQRSRGGGPQGRYAFRGVDVKELLANLEDVIRASNQIKIGRRPPGPYGELTGAGARRTPVADYTDYREDYEEPVEPDWRTPTELMLEFDCDTQDLHRLYLEGRISGMTKDGTGGKKGKGKMLFDRNEVAQIFSPGTDLAI